MKIQAGILASLAAVGESAISCGVGKELFEVDCSVDKGFTIKINENCRNSYFTMVDFANSFVWGDGAIKLMDTPAQANAAAVTSNGACTDGTNDYDVKPATTGGVQDTDNNAAFHWAQIPLNSCGITPQELTDSNNNKYVAYDLYWNSQFVDSGVANQNMYQIGQVKFRCRVDPYQEDTGLVTITEDASIDDPADKRVDIAAGLKLEIRKQEFDVSSPVDEANLQTAAINFDAQAPVTGATGMTYTVATAAKLGDYMELALVEENSSGVLSAYAVSLTKCWASTTEKAAVDDTPNQGSWYADTNDGSAGTFVFWDGFCPLYPSWVGPNPAAAYLKETWDKQSSLHAVHFRQFGFGTDQSGYAGAGASIYYHCFVKVCDKNEKTTCSTTTITGATATCNANAYSAPSRKRRSEVETFDAPDLVAPRIEVPFGCDESLGVKCLKARVSNSTNNDNSDSSAAGTTTAVAALALAMFH